MLESYYQIKWTRNRTQYHHETLILHCLKGMILLQSFHVLGCNISTELALAMASQLIFVVNAVAFAGARI